MPTEETIPELCRRLEKEIEDLREELDEIKEELNSHKSGQHRQVIFGGVHR